MPTLQSKRLRKRHSRWARANRPEAIKRRLADADARRVAAPPPIYPHERPPGSPTGEWIGGCVNGVTVLYRLDAPMPTRRGVRPRCDQRRVMLDDRQISPAMGLVQAMDALRAEFPSATSRRAIAGMQTMWTVRDELDAEAA